MSKAWVDESRRKGLGAVLGNGCLHNVLALGGSQTAARVGACRRGERLLPGNRGVTHSPGSTEQHWEHKGNTNQHWEHKPALGTQTLGPESPRGRVCPRWPRAGARPALSHPLTPLALVQEDVGDSSHCHQLCSSASAGELLLLPSCGGAACPTAEGSNSPTGGCCGEVALSSHEAGHGPGEPWPLWSMGLGVLSWAPGSHPQQSHGHPAPLGVVSVLQVPCSVPAQVPHGD